MPAHLQAQRFPATICQALGHGPAHPQGANDLGAPIEGSLHAPGALPRVLRPLQRRSRQQVVGDRQPDEEQAGCKGERAHAPVKQEDHAEEQRRPGEIEQGQRTAAAKGLPEGFERAQTGCAACRSLQACTEQALVEQALDPGPRARHDPAADQIENAHENEEHRDQAEKGQKGRQRARAQHAVIDLQHEEGGL